MKSYVLNHHNIIIYFLQLLEAEQQKVDEELAVYKNPDPAARKSSLRDQYNRKVQEQDNLGKVGNEIIVPNMGPWLILNVVKTN